MNRIGNMCVYVGDRDAAESLARQNEAGITHIITVDNYPLKWIQESSYKYLYKQTLDMQDEDLLSHFTEIFKFIDQVDSDKQEKVLIHCFAGMSRSATVAIGYLMYKNKVPLEVAMDILKKYRGNVKPNPGFMRQLELFEQIGFELDTGHPLYRQYKLEMLAQSVQSGNMEVKESDLAEDVGTDKTQQYFKCSKCRRALFRTSSMMQHTAGQGEAAFDWRSKIPANKRPVCESAAQNLDTVCDKSVFIEPVQWMAGSINQLEGKLLCPKCKAKIGSFIWYGERCPCGAWVAPAFHIQSSKVDLVKPLPPRIISQSNSSPAAGSSEATPT